MESFKQRITSRKFLLTIAALATLAASREWSQFVVVTLGYLGVQGTNDVIASLRAPQVSTPKPVISPNVVQPQVQQ